MAIAALEVLRSEKLVENSAHLGEVFRTEFRKHSYDFVQEIRGKGLMNAVVIDPKGRIKAWDLCLRLKDNGLLAKPTHDHSIRLAPPLTITESELRECCQIIYKTFQAV